MDLGVKEKALQQIVKPKNWWALKVWLLVRLMDYLSMTLEYSVLDGLPVLLPKPS